MSSLLDEAPALWRALTIELEHWQQQFGGVPLWWRDDDAHTYTPALDRLLKINRQQYSSTLALAVIPAGATNTLARRLQSEANCWVLQHGYRHKNFAPSTRKKCELDEDRPLAVIAKELQSGATYLAGLLGDQFLPVLVPPWNRMRSDLVVHLPAWGYWGWSGLGPASAVPGLKVANVHIDIINWRTRQFAGTGQVLGQWLRVLQQQRAATTPDELPTAIGLMTHHLAHDDKCWLFLNTFLPWIEEQVTVRWQSPMALFSPNRRL
ncbi:hypothetical protein [Zooshikella ganghwensis]|uniref:Polysaccharide deacetylase n=1 Tax=Zooshikella ganghwensis TaxID=202772 RepID=A0A4V1INM9_9GAMM|nr:hypothetical protein [Zooshikella ganghwensis]RDH44291.1 hypothetical protein B9G39_13005 [Zooshikella ganghwensis]